MASCSVSWCFRLQLLTHLNVYLCPSYRSSHTWRRENALHGNWLSRYSDQVTGWPTDEARFSSRQGQEIFLFSITSRPALGPTQAPVRWVPGALSPVLKRQGREAHPLPPVSVEVKNGGAMHHSSICLYDMV
jgi:hypothetical protein